MRLYAFLRACARVVLLVLFRFSVTRKADTAQFEGGCIVAVNHISFWDPIFISRCAPKRHMTFMARTSLFHKPIVGFCLKMVQAVPVDRDNGDSTALRTALTLLKNGSMIGIYPQGTRCPDRHPSETEFESGAAYMAMSAGVPIIPVGVATKNYRVRWFRRVSAVVGEPVYFEKVRDRAVITENTEKIKQIISALCDEAMENCRKGKKS